MAIPEEKREVSGREHYYGRDQTHSIPYSIRDEISRNDPAYTDDLEDLEMDKRFDDDGDWEGFRLSLVRDQQQ